MTPAQQQQAIAEAVALLNQKKPKDAAEKLREPLRSRDAYTKSAAQFYAGHCLAQLGRHEEARRMWLSVAAPKHDHPATAHYHYAGRIEVARLYLDGHLHWPEREPSNSDTEPRSMLAPSAKSRRAPQSPLEVLEQVSTAPPIAARQAEAALILARRAAKEKQPELAQTWCQRGLELLEKLEPVARRPELTQDKDSLAAQLETLRNAQAQIASRQQARKANDQAAAEAAAALPAAIRLGTEFFEKARAAAKAGDPRAAADQLRKMLRLAPGHPDADHAKYLVGRYLLDAGDRSGAVRHWDRFVNADPTGAFRGQAMLDMVDDAMFEQFDLKAARRRLQQIEGSIQTLLQESSVEPSSSFVRAGSFAGAEQLQSLPISWQHAYRSLLRRQSLLAWLRDANESAVRLFEQSLKQSPVPAEDFHDSAFFTGKSATATVEALRTGTLCLIAQTLPREGPDERVVIAMRFGELASSLRMLNVARAFFDVVGSPHTKLRPTPNQEAYALACAGRCAGRQFKFEIEAAYNEEIVKRPHLSRTPEAARALQVQATLAFSVDQDRKRALMLMQRVCDEYPESDAAIDAIFYIGVIWEWTDEREKAIKAYERALAAYPDHPGMLTAVRNRFNSMNIPPPDWLLQTEQLYQLGNLDDQRKE